MRGWGVYINWIMVIWTAFEVVILVFPTVMPITAANMNYAVRLPVYHPLTPAGTHHRRRHARFRSLVCHRRSPPLRRSTQQPRARGRTRRARKAREQGRIRIDAELEPLLIQRCPLDCLRLGLSSFIVAVFVLYASCCLSSAARVDRFCPCRAAESIRNGTDRPGGIKRWIRRTRGASRSFQLSK